MIELPKAEAELSSHQGLEIKGDHSTLIFSLIFSISISHCYSKARPNFSVGTDPARASPLDLPLLFIYGSMTLHDESTPHLPPL